MPLYLGIDAGGTKTECAVADERRILARATAGSSKTTRVGPERARANLLDGIHNALHLAGEQPSALTAVAVGASGTTVPAIAELYRVTLAELTTVPVQIVPDNIIALEAAFQGGPGVLVIAGTGSIALARDSRGATARAGGWGPLISDEGSGFWIGRNAVSAAMRAYDQGHKTILVHQILSAWNVGVHEQIVSLANSSPAPDFAALFPRVLAAAEGGDAIASGLLQQAGVELALLAKSVMRKLWPSTPAVSIAVAGGVFESARQVRVVFQNTVLAEYPQAGFRAEVVDPVLGAIWLARRVSPRQGTEAPGFNN